MMLSVQGRCQWLSWICGGCHKYYIDFHFPKSISCQLQSQSLKECCTIPELEAISWCYLLVNKIGSIVRIAFSNSALPHISIKRNFALKQFRLADLTEVKWFLHHILSDSCYIINSNKTSCLAGLHNCQIIFKSLFLAALKVVCIIKKTLVLHP